VSILDCDFRIGSLGLIAFGAGCYFVTDFETLSGREPPDTSSTASASSSSNGGSAAMGGSGGEGGSSAASTSTGGGTPCPPPNVDYSGLVLNELAPRGLPEDWMELRNNSASSIPLCGAFITQGYDGTNPPGGGDRFTFGAVTIGAGQYLVINQNADFPYGLAKDEPERITLFAPDGSVLDDTEWVVGVVDEFETTESWSRIPDADGPFKRVPSPTKGNENIDLGAGGAGGGTASSNGGAGG
jgi:hypothetical protein